MNGYVFGNDDFLQIDKLIKVTSSIDSIYRKLYDLEISGKKYTDDYNKLIEELKLAIEIEKKQYKDCNLNYWKCVAWYNYFLNKKVPENFVNGIESIMKQDYNYRIIRKIISKLDKKIALDCKTLKQSLPLDLEKELKKMGIYNNDNFLSKIINGTSEIIFSLDEDILNAYLTFLEEFKTKNGYKYIQKELINSKYNLSFINNKIENNMISSDFEVSDKLSINSKFYADFMNIDFETYNKLRNSNGEEKVMYQIMELLEIGDMDYSDTSKIYTSVLRQCLIRANLLVMGDDMVSKVNSKFHTHIQSKKYLQKHSDDKISRQLIDNCFNNLEKDREKVSIVSFSIR